MVSKIQIPDKGQTVAVEICRFLLAGVFLFSGYVKAIDPWGTVYKNLDYFEAFGLGFFGFLALPFAFFLFSFEFLLGAGLLFGIYRKACTFLTLVFMLFMTPLTLYLAIADPVSDCGCFGEALIISNWETFAKNVVLLSAAFVVFRGYKRIYPLYSPKSKSLSMLWSVLFILGFSYYTFRYLPVMDFRPYKVGANLPELMETPEDAEVDEYETILFYSKDGETKEFTMENYPRNDDSWTFVDSQTKLIKKGYEPPIHDFVILTDDDEDITDVILENPSYTFLLISHKLEKASEAHVDDINEIFDYAQEFDYDFYALTASLPEKIQEWRENTGAEYPFGTMDEIALKTVIRSNPGLVLMKDGTIINKWAEGNLPDPSQLNELLENLSLGQIPPDYSIRKVLISGLIFFLPLITLFLFDYFVRKKKKTN